MEHHPLILDNGRLRQLAAVDRIPLQHVPVVVERTLEWSSSTPNRYQTVMSAGVGTYVLPALPVGDIEVQINGVGVNFTLAGVNLTITEYSAGSIESTDELTVYYSGGVVSGSDTIHEPIVAGGEVVMTNAT